MVKLQRNSLNKFTQSRSFLYLLFYIKDNTLNVCSTDLNKSLAKISSISLSNFFFFLYSSFPRTFLPLVCHVTDVTDVPVLSTSSSFSVCLSDRLILKKQLYSWVQQNLKKICFLLIIFYYYYSITSIKVKLSELFKETCMPQDQKIATGNRKTSLGIILLR